VYDFDYFERGLETGLSNYQNYRWEPELTIPMAMVIIDLLGIKRTESVLDYGCAKGFLVKALRMLGRNAAGADISTYAINSAPADVKSYLMDARILLRAWKSNSTYKYKYVICKDVLEHIPLIDLRYLLQNMQAETVFTVVPLGSDGKYFAAANGRDVTHIICEPEAWWLKLFQDNGWVCTFNSNRVVGIKDHYNDIPNAHLFMVHRRAR